MDNFEYICNQAAIYLILVVNLSHDHVDVKQRIINILNEAFTTLLSSMLDPESAPGDFVKYIGRFPNGSACLHGY